MSRRALRAITHVLIREKQREILDTNTQRRKHVTPRQKLEQHCHQPRNAGSPQNLEEARNL